MREAKQTLKEFLKESVDEWPDDTRIIFSQGKLLGVKWMLEFAERWCARRSNSFNKAGDMEQKGPPIGEFQKANELLAAMRAEVGKV